MAFRNENILIGGTAQQERGDPSTPSRAILYAAPAHISVSAMLQ